MAGGSPQSKALVGVDGGVGKHGELPHPIENAGDERTALRQHALVAGAEDAGIVLLDADGDLQSASAAIGEGLGHERGVEAVLGGNGLDDSLIVHHVVGSGEGVAACKVDLVLSGAVLVAGCGGVQSHLVQREADLPAGVLALVQRCHVQITALIAGGAGRLALHVGFEHASLAG